MVNHLPQNGAHLFERLVTESTIQEDEIRPYSISLGGANDDLDIYDLNLDTSAVHREFDINEFTGGTRGATCATEGGCTCGASCMAASVCRC